MRRMLVILLLALSGVLLGELPAHACSCVTQTTQDQVKRASDVFLGTITTRSKADDKVTYEVDVERVYKGDVTTPATVTSAGSSASCGLDSLAADKRYLFLGTAQGESVEVNLCGGTAPATARKVDRISTILGAGSAPATPPDAEPVQATITRVDDSQPASFSRLAAPGGALLLVGLLGLFLLRRVARSR
ncbi:conserved exported hypothetical protein [metagenome]|uniref:Uncharacterized protein n=1 Tax=metagenome TaxID=256318 RepID=A0A2P2C0X3_9ZZZZ